MAAVLGVLPLKLSLEGISNLVAAPLPPLPHRALRTRGEWYGEAMCGNANRAARN